MLELGKSAYGHPPLPPPCPRMVLMHSYSTCSSGQHLPRISKSWSSADLLIEKTVRRAERERRERTEDISAEEGREDCWREALPDWEMK